MRPRFAVAEVVGVDEQFEFAAAAGVDVPGQVRIEQGVAGRGGFVGGDLVLFRIAHCAQRCT